MSKFAMRSSAHPWHILVVDNDPTKLEELTQRLERAGHQVSTCSSIQRLDADMASLGPDLVLLDVLMPQLDASELSRLLRAHPANSHLPIVLHSPIAGNTLRRLIETSGALGVIEASLDEQEFLLTLGRFLEHLQLRNKLRLPAMSGTHRIQRSDARRASSMPPMLRLGRTRGR